ncbi:hypothetical protein ACKQTC_00465 [Peptococcus simiae]|uniref:Transmembrane protein (PGPGW) n=1 Tax=Peptococcus simiae TaxID=1643805 RepID=A0ABW9GVT9_9FIRM
MSVKQKMGYWRLAMALLVYAVIWMGYKGWVPYWGGAFLLPIGTLFRPYSAEGMKNWPRVEKAGLFFYTVKWFAVILLVLAGGLVLGAAFFAVPLSTLVPVLQKEWLVVIPLLFVPVCSYLNYAKHFVNDSLRRAQAAPQNGRRKKKKSAKRR